MNFSAIPLACTLTQNERLTRQEIVCKLKPAVQEVQEREHGYAYRFASDDKLPEIIEIVRMERRCCPFMRFSLTAEPDNGPLWLEITGPEGVKEFLAAFFG